ncbi:MAG TPA: hypothetical protein VFK04_10045 [Gemmatimonadaceae bacterium]|nr:hypothetical protein [Gemmatimonadaceae bacterium]
MRSRVDSRPALEWVLRAGSLALLAWMIWLSTAARRAAGEHRVSSSATLGDSLAAWTLDPRADSLHAALDELPRGEERDWLAALRRAGATVTWSSPASTPVALAVEALNDPAGGVRASLAAPSGALVVVSDSLGVLDTVVMAGPSAALRARAVLGGARASAGGASASAALRDSLVQRGVAVIGRAGWEAKFVIAALEESGWKVSARLAVAPDIFVRQGSVKLDTASTGVVVALDSTAARDARAIERFVRSGGGLVLAGDAARSAGFARIAAGGVGTRVRSVAISFSDSAPRRALGFYPISARADDVVPLESRDGAMAVAARRVGAGRVVQLGYDETWRWRLQGGSTSPEAHRAWWSSVIGSAAYRAARQSTLHGETLDPAPLAATFSALGAPVAPERAAPALQVRPGLRWWMLLMLLAMLLAEWASRRLRGAS